MSKQGYRRERWKMDNQHMQRPRSHSHPPNIFVIPILPVMELSKNAPMHHSRSQLSDQLLHSSSVTSDLANLFRRERGDDWLCRIAMASGSK